MRNRILFIDNVFTPSPIPGVLAGAGYRVETVDGAGDGLRCMKARPFDVIILRESPQAGIRETCERIRAFTPAPLIVISPDSSAETCVSAINAGADYFMRKPFGPLELAARINSLLQRQPAPVVS